MTEKALVTSTENTIEAVHFEKEECISCTTGCAKVKNPFEITNPKGFEIKKGSVVIVAASKKVQAVQGLCSLFIPFLSAIGGYIFSPAIMSLFGRTIHDDARAVFVLLFLVLSAAAVYIITRKFPVPGKPEIVEVL